MNDRMHLHRKNNPAFFQGAFVFLAMFLLVAGASPAPTDESLVETNAVQETGALALPKGNANSGMPANNPPEHPPPTEQQLTADFLAANQARYKAAIARAKAWLDALEVNPYDLREHGIKGKKKLAELLDTYRRLLAFAAAPDKPAIKERIRKIAEVTEEARFHDLPELDETAFKEDATSYLRIAFLLDQMGLMPPIYRKEIDRAHPRLNEHMRTRGVNQQMAFHLYYQHFQLQEPFPLATAFKSGVIAARRPAAWFTRRPPLYDLTHEIFVPYEFGEKQDADFFSDEDKTYLRFTLPEVARFYINIQDPDVVGELSSCMSYLKFTDTKDFRDALDYLLNAQRETGAWGSYDWLRNRYGNYVDQAFYLHTTMVVLDALAVAFEPTASTLPTKDKPTEPASNSGADNGEKPQQPAPAQSMPPDALNMPEQAK